MPRRSQPVLPAIGDNSGGVAADRLLRFIERLERLDEEIAGLKDDRKEVVIEAKSTGFDARTIGEILKLRKLSQEERDEREALLDIYKAALGMLSDTPLGAAAIRRLSPKPPPPPGGGAPGPDPGAQENGDDPDDIADALAPADPGPSIEEAHAMGAAAAAEGKPVGANPFPAATPHRAAWDESWCRAAGSDGMDLPEAWRRSPKKPPDAPAPAPAADPKDDDA
ncbi:DUF2312 domain-containing protein [Inquilinus sp. CA228]|uniref:DUF2312 domain-containing protein n=1 Tax=Inquilinus sp. CA228 TaxID=3455609 RepID=UPI003F8D5A9F